MENIEEIWKDIPGYDDKYQASNLGNIRSKDRFSGRYRKGKVLKPILKSGGYFIVHLWYEGKQTTTEIHKLVTLAFLGDRIEGYQVNHIDGIKTNNNILNLEYVTRSENVLHSYRLGLEQSRKGSLNPKAKLTEEDVVVIMSYPISIGNGKISRDTGFSIKIIRRIRTGVYWNHITKLPRIYENKNANNSS